MEGGHRQGAFAFQSIGQGETISNNAGHEGRAIERGHAPFQGCSGQIDVIAVAVIALVLDDPVLPVMEFEV